MAKVALIAAPASGSGKTVITLGLLRHFRRQRRRIVSFKVGPDYIDPGFHRRASGAPCFNLDPWAMQATTRRAIAARALESADGALVEGVMGLFDGATDGTGSTADIATEFSWPIILVVDASAQAGSVGALVRGFATHRANVVLAGLLFNRVGGASHVRTLRDAVAPLGVPVFGALPRDSRLTLPSRHLGLVLADEHGDLDRFLDGAAAAVAEHIDIDALADVMVESRPDVASPEYALAPLGARIAVASDQAFAFFYPHLAQSWRRAGATLLPFSPLGDEAPDPSADAIFLPGGYPELYAEKITCNTSFLGGLRAAAARGVTIYGECGGYMVLGDALIARDGKSHLMAGLLPVTTSFADPTLHVGYRRIEAAAATPYGDVGATFRGHEFHYARAVVTSGDDPLFLAEDARGDRRQPMGSVRGSVSGSFAHLVDRFEA